MNMPAELAWLVGRRLVQVAKIDYSWRFTLTDGGIIMTESGWRLVTQKGIEVASEDHGQIFGLKEPVDASARVIAAINGKKILAVTITERTSDLSLRFDEQVTLEFLNLSCGYESWRAKQGAAEVICMGGGQLAIYPDDRKG